MRSLFVITCLLGTICSTSKANAEDSQFKLDREEFEDNYKRDQEHTQIMQQQLEIQHQYQALIHDQELQNRRDLDMAYASKDCEMLIRYWSKPHPASYADIRGYRMAGCGELGEPQAKPKFDPDKYLRDKAQQKQIPPWETR